jgi:hypothetical protein
MSVSLMKRMPARETVAAEGGEGHVSRPYGARLTLRTPERPAGATPTRGYLRAPLTGRRVRERVDLEHHAHRGRQRDALVRDEREHLVVVCGARERARKDVTRWVVQSLTAPKSHCRRFSTPPESGHHLTRRLTHDGVHGLDPDGVDVAVQHDPLGGLVRAVAELLDVLGHATHDDGQHAVAPLLGQRHVAVQLVGGDRLGVHDVVDDGRLVLGLAQVVRRSERLPHRRLAAARGPHEHDGVADVQQLLQLHNLGDEARVRLQRRGLGLLARLHCRALQLRGELGGQRVEPREQVLRA